MKLDLHVHSCFSPDSKSPVEAIVKQAHAVGLNGLAITDHNSIDAFFEAQEIVEEAGLGLIVISGVEVSTKEGHLIALGVENPPPARMPFNETADQVHKDGGIVVAPHPFKFFRNGVGSLKGRRLDAVEVFNSRSLFGFANYLAANSAAHLGLGVTGGSDAHNVDTVGLAYTEVNVKDDASAQDVLNAIKAGKSHAKGRVSPRLLFFTHPFKGLVGNLGR
ncbi:MAG: PHP domain-containing protein [Euryarchaeota archaeon]|nr:PHP domain-containing protein [Euryarchaeota archaeon]